MIQDAKNKFGKAVNVVEALIANGVDQMAFKRRRDLQQQTQ
jgi:hypothetical protein